MADRDYPLSWPSAEAHREVTEWFRDEFTKLKRTYLLNALHKVERRTDFPKIYRVPGGLPADTETASKTLVGLNFGTAQADIGLTIDGQAATVTDLTGGNTVEFTCPALGRTAEDVVVVELAVAGVVTTMSVAVL